MEPGRSARNSIQPLYNPMLPLYNAKKTKKQQASPAKTRMRRPLWTWLPGKEGVGLRVLVFRAKGVASRVEGFRVEGSGFGV